MRVALTDRIFSSERRSMHGAARGAFLLAVLVVGSQCVTACSQVFLTGWQISTARQKAFWFQAEYRRVAAVVARGPLQYADRDTVEYAPAKGSKSGGFASWDKAKVPSDVRDELQVLFDEGHAQVVLVDDRRVNFVIRGLGIFPFQHGWEAYPMGQGDLFTRAGVIVTDETGCEALAMSIKMKRCEQLDGQTYFYLF